MSRDATATIAHDTLSTLLASVSGGSGERLDDGADAWAPSATHREHGNAGVPAPSSGATVDFDSDDAAQATKRRRTLERHWKDAEIIGDDAFAVLYAEMHPQVISIVLRILRDRAMAEEVAQDVMLEVWRKADRFDPSRGSARAWVTTLARRRAVDRVRSEQAGRDRDERVFRRDVAAPRDEVAEEVELQLDHWQVRRALHALTERQREAIQLAYFDGYTYRDVAEVLGIPEGTAKSRLRDGLQRLSAELHDLV